MKTMTNEALKARWRTLCEDKIYRGADQIEFEHCWFESCNRGLGQEFSGIYQEIKEQHKVEQLDQMNRIQALGVKA